MEESRLSKWTYVLGTERCEFTENAGVSFELLGLKNWQGKDELGKLKRIDFRLLSMAT